METLSMLLLQLLQTLLLLFPVIIIYVVHGATTEGGEAGAKNYSGVQQVSVLHYLLPQTGH